MNKGDLIEVIAEETGITKVQANEVLDSFTEAVAKAGIKYLNARKKEFNKG